jgi:hypothetical protein
VVNVDSYSLTLSLSLFFFAMKMRFIERKIKRFHLY